MFTTCSACRLCSEGSEETQEHLQLCRGTLFERRGLDMSKRSGGILEEDDSEDGCSDLKRSIYQEIWCDVQHSSYFLLNCADIK